MAGHRGKNKRKNSALMRRAQMNDTLFWLLVILGVLAVGLYIALKFFQPGTEFAISKLFGGK